MYLSSLSLSVSLSLVDGAKKNSMCVDNAGMMACVGLASGFVIGIDVGHKKDGQYRVDAFIVKQVRGGSREREREKHDKPLVVTLQVLLVQKKFCCL